MDTVYVVTNGETFLDWDDRGAMASGYPMWVPLTRARKYETQAAAERSGEAAARAEKRRVWTQAVTLILADKVEVVLPENDPEWGEYERLKTKFNNR